jgi:TonB family protein
MLFATLALVLGTTIAQSQVTVAASDDLAAARALYASGDYEQALSRLAVVRTESTADEVDQYRALCLLALGRTAETERSLQELISRRPLFRMTDADVSPRLVALFHSVRKRVLPGAVKELYAKARTNFEQKQYVAASTQLKDVLDLIEDEDLDQETGAFADLRLLAEGFLKLADVQIEAARAAEAAAAAAARAAAPEPVAPPPPEPTVYSDVDAGITPPVTISRAVPPWRRPTTPALAGRSYQGHLRVLIDEQGRVESANLIRPLLEGYDNLLLEAVRKWEFRPATKDGRPVKYVKLFTIDVSPR